MPAVGVPKSQTPSSPGPASQSASASRGLDLRGAPRTRQLDHHDEAFISAGAENQLPGLTYGRLSRELRHWKRLSAQRRLRGRDQERAEQVAAGGGSLAHRARRRQTGATGPREAFRPGSQAGYVPVSSFDNSVTMTCSVRSRRPGLATCTATGKIAACTP